MEIPKPMPTLDDPTSDEYWAGCKRHELLIQHCKKCGHQQFPPRQLCTECLSTDLEWVKASGKGRVYSFTVWHQSQHPAFQPEIPYVNAIIRLAEGPRMTSNIVNCNPEDVTCEMPVEIVFEDWTPEVSIPKFKPIK